MGGAVIEENNGDISGPRKWKQVVAISNQIWRGWLIEYLLTLQSRRKWTVNQTNLKPGTIVFLKEESLPRGKGLSHEPFLFIHHQTEL